VTAREPVGKGAAADLDGQHDERLGEFYEEYADRRPEIADAARVLREEAEATTCWDVGAFTRFARLREEIVGDLDDIVERLAAYGITLDGSVLEETLRDLAGVEDALRRAENDPGLLERMLDAVRSDFCGSRFLDTPVDERPVTVGFSGDRLAGPGSHIVVELLRLLALSPETGGAFDGFQRIVVMPAWLLERLEAYESLLHVRVEGSIEGRVESDVVAAANVLWDPVSEDAAYSTVEAAVEAAGLLAV